MSSKKKKHSLFLPPPNTPALRVSPPPHPLQPWRSLGAQILRALQQLPTEAEEALLIRLAVALAAADVGHSDFYRKVGRSRQTREELGFEALRHGRGRTFLPNTEPWAQAKTCGVVGPWSFYLTHPGIQAMLTSTSWRLNCLSCGGKP